MIVVLDSIERGARAPVAVRRLKELARKTLSAAGVKSGRVELSVAFVNSARSEALNRHYRGKAAPADVLSFHLGASGNSSLKHSAVLSAEIVLCPPAIRRAARASRRPLARQTELLFIHGLLHMLGYDHRKAHDEAVMHALEERAAGESFVF